MREGSWVVEASWILNPRAVNALKVQARPVLSLYREGIEAQKCVKSLAADTQLVGGC